mgnify:CR=1 FL=1
MEKENRELDDFVHYRHVAKSGESYFLTIGALGIVLSHNISTLMAGGFFFFFFFFFL